MLHATPLQENNRKVHKKSFCEPSQGIMKLSNYAAKRQEKSLGRTPETEKRSQKQMFEVYHINRDPYLSTASNNYDTNPKEKQNKPFDMVIKEEMDESKYDPNSGLGLKSKQNFSNLKIKNCLDNAILMFNN